MKLLFDENLSPHLVAFLSDLYPESTHVTTIGLASEDDAIVWSYAQDHDFIIVSKDEDFYQRSFVFGAPPKVVWIRRGNCSTADIASVLRDRHTITSQFERDEHATFLELS